VELRGKKYKTSDIFRLPFRAAPVFVVIKVVVAVLQATMPTVVTALATAFFVDTALAVFADEMAASSIYLPLGVLIGVVGVGSVLGGFHNVIQARIKFGMERAFMPAFLDVRGGLSFKHIEDAASWELIERVSKKPMNTFLEGTQAYVTVVRCVVAIVAILGLIMAHVWWAVPVIGAFSVPLFWIAFRAGQKNYDAEVETRKFDRRYEYYTEVLTSREHVEERTLFDYADHVNVGFTEQFELARNKQFWVNVKMWVAMKSASIAMGMIAILIALTLINPVISGYISPGTFMGILTAVFGMVALMGWPLQEATENISKSREYMKDLTAFVELEQTEGAHDLPDAEPITFESMEFRNVRFKYPTGKEYILDALSFRLEGGKHYAFVGANGAGKTTITKLLTGLYDEYEGEILINGKELREYSQSALKALFSVVYQDFARYQVSMADNIALGDAARTVGADEVLNAAAKMELDETIASLKDGINTPLGKIAEGGADLSGGQWQKVAIARSLISRAPIKILDEPTAALDPIAESRIYQEFEGLMRDKTTIFISHRLGSTKLANEILVIDAGRVTERGSHDALMKIEGTYAQMFDAQRKWYE